LGVGGRKRKSVGVKARGKKVGCWGKKKKEKKAKEKAQTSGFISAVHLEDWNELGSNK
jgi:hypothetical protein